MPAPFCCQREKKPYRSNRMPFKKHLCFFFPLFLWAAAAVAGSIRKDYSGHKVIRAWGDTARDVFDAAEELEGGEEIRIRDVDLIRATLDVSVSGKGKEREADLLSWMEARGLRAEVVVGDLGELFEAEREAIEERRRRYEGSGGGKAVDFDVDNYHRHDEINQFLLDLEAEYPEVTTEVIGNSFEGREMMALKFCRGECGGNPIMWIDAGIHANEWIGPASTLYVMDTLIQGLSDEDQDLLGIDWYFLPVVNPDGYEYTWDFDRNWRRTRHVIPENICVGVDPNRNFGYHWSESGSSNLSCAWNYHGPEAWSEVEVVNLSEYIEGLDPRPVYYQNMHTPAQMILYPWGYICETEGNDDAPDQDAMAAKGNDAIVSATGTHYLFGPICETLYAASGNAVDWAYGAAGIKYAYTMELRAPDFVVPPEEIENNAADMWAFHASAARDIMEEFA